MIPLQLFLDLPTLGLQVIDLLRTIDRYLRVDISLYSRVSCYPANRIRTVKSATSGGAEPITPRSDWQR